MMLSGIAPLDQEDIAVLKVNPVIGHCATPERLCQSRYSWAVSDTGLVVDIHQAQRPCHGGHHKALFIVYIGASMEGYSLNAIYRLSLAVGGDEVSVSYRLNLLCNSGDCPIPILLLPFIAVRSAIQHIGEAMLVGSRSLHDIGSLGTERPFVYRMVRVSFDVEDFSILIGAANQTTSDRTIAADGRCLSCVSAVCSFYPCH